MNQPCQGGCYYWDCGRPEGHAGPCQPDTSALDVVSAAGLAAFCQRRPGDLQAVHDARAALVVGLAAFTWEN